MRMCSVGRWRCRRMGIRNDMQFLTSILWMEFAMFRRKKSICSDTEQCDLDRYLGCELCALRAREGKVILVLGFTWYGKVFRTCLVR